MPKLPNGSIAPANPAMLPLRHTKDMYTLPWFTILGTAIKPCSLQSRIIGQSVDNSRLQAVPIIYHTSTATCEVGYTAQ